MIPKAEQGFTLLEMLLSVTIIGLLAGLSVPVYESFVRRNDLDLTTQSLASALRRAEAYARGVNYDSEWGVAVQSGAITLFRGATYASRNTAFDEVVDIPDSITPSGLTEVRFSRVWAQPHTTGAITLSSTTNSTRTVTINAKGMVEY